MYIKKGDTVVLRTGKYKNMTGVVDKVFPQENKVIVKGEAKVGDKKIVINEVTKSKKARSAQDQGGLVKKIAKMDASNVALMCSNPECVKNGKATRVKIVTQVVDGKETKLRACVKCGAVIDATPKKAKKEPAKKAPATKKTSTRKTKKAEAPADAE